MRNLRFLIIIDNRDSITKTTTCCDVWTFAVLKINTTKQLNN